ncbi:MAG: hypothetical protein DWQ02_25055 [Bacteroidetes bacterium]|nr:MAG: hypothetical protein DWQ02_25055 [Bacteroidota bacterium]
MIRKFLNLLFYSNFWIAACALAMALQTKWLLSGKIGLSNLEWFILCSTLSLYAVHRLTGMVKLKDFADKGRYSVISRFRNHIAFYAIISAITGAWFYFQLDLNLQVHLALTGVISLGYVLPVLGTGKRLRDVHYLKIFLIAITWAWVTVVVPALSENQPWSVWLSLLTLERVIFIFAITLPFDIRDYQIDAHTGVKTIPGYIGMVGTKRLSVACLAVTLFLAALNLGHIYSWVTFAGFFISILLTAIIVWKADKVRHDYYFTGLVDGTMVLQFLLVWGFGG